MKAGSNMSEDLQTEIVDSPDDGGYWISQWDPKSERSRASVKVFSSLPDASRALEAGKVRWEKWS